jgi:phosphoenolpyruvate synthase/pyruvate phosphate dikinase
MDRKSIEMVKQSVYLELQRLKALGLTVSHDVLSDQNIAEILGTHPTPMSHGLFCYCFAHGEGAIKIGRNQMGYEIGKELDQGFQILVEGQPRCSIVHDALTYRIRGIPLKDYSNIIKYYLDQIEKNPLLANYPEIVLYEQTPSLEFLEKIFGKSKAKEFKNYYDQFLEGIKKLESTLEKKCEEEFVPKWKLRIENLWQKARKAETIPEMINVFKETIDALRIDACVTFVLVARLGFFSYARLWKEFYRYYRNGAQKKLDSVTSECNPDKNPTIEMPVLLYKYKLGEISFDEILKRYGHLGPHELEISNPRYREQPELLRKQALQIVTNPLAELRKTCISSREIEKEILEIHPEFKHDIDTARKYLALRETKGYDILRFILKKIENKLRWPEDLIFFLRPEETPMIEKMSIAEIEARRAEWKNNCTLRIPPIIDTRNWDWQTTLIEKERNILYGLGATNKIAEGEVVVLLDPKDFHTASLLAPGKILVTKCTDPTWTPLMAAVKPGGGIITEIGGVLAHAAVVAREFGIAAVLNVPEATSILKTGMRVRVDGREGKVIILK